LSYCKAAKGHPFHGPYHDRECGFPIRSDASLLERLALEINQAGLSWLTMLQKREGFRRAFDGFDPETVAAYGERKYKQLLMDPSIIRNRLKIRAVIENARRVVDIRKRYGSFARWLDAHHPRSRKAWQTLFKETFVFMGGEIVGSFLLGTGYLRGAHIPSHLIGPNSFNCSSMTLRSPTTTIVALSSCRYFLAICWTSAGVTA
jgi:DNA-3-methyladenine glycosylase I